MLTKTTKILSPSQKAHKTARWAKTMTRWLIKYTCNKGVKWKFVEFDGVGKAESRGIVDFIAIRKDHRETAGLKRGDLFEIILLQVKGGSARFPNDSDIDRLVKVAKFHRAKAIVLAEWKLGKKPNLYRLVNRMWKLESPMEIFVKKKSKFIM